MPDSVCLGLENANMLSLLGYQQIMIQSCRQLLFHQWLIQKGSSLWITDIAVGCQLWTNSRASVSSLLSASAVGALLQRVPPGSPSPLPPRGKIKFLFQSVVCSSVVIFINGLECVRLRNQQLQRHLCFPLPCAGSLQMALTKMICCSGRFWKAKPGVKLLSKKQTFIWINKNILHQQRSSVKWIQCFVTGNYFSCFDLQSVTNQQNYFSAFSVVS